MSKDIAIVTPPARTQSGTCPHCRAWITWVDGKIGVHQIRDHYAICPRGGR